MIVFIDDILVYSKTKGNHVCYLRIVLQRSREEELYAKISKCEFWVSSMTFLGHMLSKQDVMIDLAKIEVVRGWTMLTSTTEIRSFIVSARYYP